jgi:hypothetical protein
MVRVSFGAKRVQDLTLPAFDKGPGISDYSLLSFSFGLQELKFSLGNRSFLF